MSEPQSEAVPVLQLTDEFQQVTEPREKAEEERPRRSSETLMTKKEKATTYFIAQGIPLKMDMLLTQVLAQRPDNPLSFCVALLKAEEFALDGRAIGPDRLSDAELKQRITAPGAREYILAHKLPWLFDDLLSGLAIERPIDPHGWALQWLKFRRLKTGVPLDEEGDYLNGVKLV
jgi:hypothetical protein